MVASSCDCQLEVSSGSIEHVDGSVCDSVSNKLCGRPPLQVDLRPLTLKVVFESRVTWATSVPILVFLGLSVLDLGPMYATDRQTSDVRRASSLNAS